MELRILKHVYLSPWIRLNLYTKGRSISFGHRRLGWLTLGSARSPGDFGYPSKRCLHH